MQTHPEAADLRWIAFEKVIAAAIRSKLGAFIQLPI